MKYLCAMIIMLLVSGCIKEYKFSGAFCNNELYVETFANKLGVCDDYLTDSMKFRINIGEWDSEHENFIYRCSGNRISVIKIRKGYTNCHLVITPDGKKTIKCDIDTIERKVYKLDSLKK